MVVYNVILSPLKSPPNLGSAVPISWQLKDALGNIVVSLSTMIKMESVFNGAGAGRRMCCVGERREENVVRAPNGATGSSSFRIVSGGYQFNWDTTTATAHRHGVLYGADLPE